MPELLLYVRPTGSYDEGDIIIAPNRTRIRCVHAELICFEKMEGGRLKDMDGNGIMPVGHVSQDFCETVYEYRLERLSDTEADWVRISDGARIRFRSGDVWTDFNGKAACTNLPEFWARKRKANQFPVYGRYKREIGYFGDQDRSAGKIDAVWDHIHAKTPHRDTDPERTLYPLGTQDIRSFLVIPVNDFDDAERESLTTPRLHPVTGEVQKKRGRRVANWRGLLAQLGVTESQALDSNFPIDKRREVPPWAHGPLVVDKPQ